MLLSYNEIILRLAAAWVCGVLLGLERQRRGKPVGISTYVLVSLSACSIAILSAYGFQDIPHVGNSDPARLVVGILTGMGFLGAGIIWRSQEGSIYGLTTAADMWATACLGIIWGLGEFFLGLATLTLILGTLFVVKRPNFRKLISKQEESVDTQTDFHNIHDE